MRLSVIKFDAMAAAKQCVLGVNMSWQSAKKLFSSCFGWLVLMMQCRVYWGHVWPTNDGAYCSKQHIRSLCVWTMR